MSSCDKDTFTAILSAGIFMSQSLARQSDNGRVSYVPDGWEVQDYSGKLYGHGHTPEGAIAAAYEQIARPSVWRVLAPPADD